MTNNSTFDSGYYNYFWSWKRTDNKKKNVSKKLLSFVRIVAGHSENVSENAPEKF